MTSQHTAPISATRLKQICTDACESTLGKADYYDHTKVCKWNASIIQSILKAVISEATPEGESGPDHKFMVNSTIVQHLVPDHVLNKPRGGATAAEDGGDKKAPAASGDGAAGTTDGTPHVGRRGLHSATQAYWNEKTDGMWNFKYNGGEAKGMDAVICVIWVSRG